MKPSESLQSEREGSWRLLVAAWLVLTPAVLFAGFQQIFATHANYDDEGYVMLSLVSFMEGKPLYDETYTQYGPFYFIAQSAFHGWTGLPIIHDVVRLKTLGVWLAVATLAMSYLFHETKSWRLATIGFLLTFFHLDRLCLEPGHPQEFCVLAVAIVLVLSGRLVRSSRPIMWAVLIGLAVGALAMVKLNIGIFLFVSMTLLLLLRGPRNVLGKALFGLGAVGAVALPFLLTLSHFKAGSGMALPIICSASLGCILMTSRDRDTATARLTMGSWFAFLAGVGAMIAFSCGMALMSGTSTDGLWHGLIGQHLGFDRSFYTPAPLHGAAVILVVVMLDAALRGRDRRVIGLARLGIVATLAFCMFQYLPETRHPLIHGMNDRGASGLLLGAALPALWVLLLPGIGIAASREDGDVFLGRLPLCLIAALQPMAAYPTPGTQMAIGTLVLALGALIALRDVLLYEREWLPRAELAVPCVLLLLACTLLLRGAHGYQYRNSLTPLALPGANLMRVPQEKAEKFQWLVSSLNADADTFVFGEHACNSFYFWTRKRPPTSLNPTFWPFLLRDDEQQRVIAALDASPRTAVVHLPFDVELPEGPLLNYLEQHYRPARRREDTEVWLPQTSAEKE